MSNDTKTISINREFFRLGEWNTSAVIDCVGNLCTDPVIDIRADQIFSHNLYNRYSDSRENEIAIVKLQ